MKKYYKLLLFLCLIGCSNKYKVDQLYLSNDVHDNDGFVESNKTHEVMEIILDHYEITNDKELNVYELDKYDLLYIRYEKDGIVTKINIYSNDYGYITNTDDKKTNYVKFEDNTFNELSKYIK